MSAGRPEDVPELRLPRVAFAGRSNVGKSSLINRLTGSRQLARISRTPGRTRQVNYFLVDERLVFVDLPGYGYARVPSSMRRSWGSLSEAALLKSGGVVLTVLLLDGRHSPSELDHLMVGWLTEKGLEWIPVLTKIDKLNLSERAKPLERAAQLKGSRRGLATSARTGEGIAQLWKDIDAACRPHQQGDSPNRLRAAE